MLPGAKTSQTICESLVKPDIDAVAVDGAGIALTHTVGAGKQAIEVLRRAEDEAHAAGHIAGQ